MSVPQGRGGFQRGLAPYQRLARPPAPAAQVRQLRKKPQAAALQDQVQVCLYLSIPPTRYSAEYVITDGELAWLVERVKLLHEAVMVVCQDRLNPPHLAD